MKNATEPIKAAPTARGETHLDGMRNILEDALYEMGYDNTLVDTLIERNVIDFSTVDYTRHIIYQLEEHYGEFMVWSRLEDAVAFEGLAASLTGELGENWRASKGYTFRERILYMITAPIESLGLKVVESSELEGIKLVPQLDAVKRNVVIDYGEFGMQLPDADVIVYSPENSQIIAVISSKISVRESVVQTGYWKSKLLESENTAHIKVYLITPDRDKDLTRIDPAKEPRVIAEIDLDGTYVLTAEELEESDKIKLFEHFIEDLRQVIEESH